MLCSKVVRKAVARVLTVISQSQRSALREAYKGKVRISRAPDSGFDHQWAVGSNEYSVSAGCWGNEGIGE